MSTTNASSAAKNNIRIKLAHNNPQAGGGPVKYTNYQEFIRRHSIPKDDKETLITNTRIGNPGGKYHISENEYDVFLELYYRDIVAKNTEEFLTERQLDSGGPIVVDVDLRYDYNVTEKQYGKDHIEDLITIYLDRFKEIFRFDHQAKFPVYVFEKPTVNRVEEKDITKDGIHMIFGIQGDRITQTHIRQRILDEIKNSDLWSQIPLKNTWEDVFDQGISKGHTNWQLYGSKKPGHESYRLTRYYEIEYDETDGEMMLTDINVKKFNFSTEFKKLSVRYRHHLSPIFSADFYTLHQQRLETKPIQNTTNNTILTVPSNIGRRQTLNMNLTAIRNREDLAIAVQTFLDGLAPTEFEIREAYEYVMILPESYYGVGSYNKWIRVGWALSNISKRLLLSWIAFSAKYSLFDFASIPELVERWTSFATQSETGLTKRSIMYWAREDAPEEYERVRQTSVDYHIEQSLRASMFNGRMEKGIGCGDYDIAFILKQLFKDQFICASIKNDKWYRFDKHRWVEDECGTSLRKHLSVELRDIYRKKSTEMILKSTQQREQQALLTGSEGAMPSTDKKQPTIHEERSSCLIDIAIKLAKTSDKDHIMKEARELFYERDIKFLDLLDSNPYLICFKNGVWDFQEKVFRAGRPEDYISKSTNIDYRPLDRKRDAKIIGEIEDFMAKLFPIEQVRKYMWEHLASTLIGVNLNQTFNMYIGGGENGKSVLTDLMSQILGDYKSDAPLALITQARIKQGQASPDIVALKGIRYAVMQEPSKGDKINEGALKELTSGTEPIRGRNLFSSPITFIPQMKLCVCTNEFLEVKTRDHATWRRFRVVDFVSLFTDNPVEGDPEKPYQFKIDRKLKERFPEWREVFMAMLVDIVLQTGGNVQDCPMVLESTNKYREREDHIAEFIRDKIITQDPAGKITKSEVSREFDIWFQCNYGRNGQPPAKELYEYLDKKLGRFKNDIGAWSGAKIRYDREDTILPDDVEIDDADL